MYIFADDLQRKPDVTWFYSVNANPNGFNPTSMVVKSTGTGFELETL
jgi:hypothetical protein